MERVIFVVNRLKMLAIVMIGLLSTHMTQIVDHVKLIISVDVVEMIIDSIILMIASHVAYIGLIVKVIFNNLIFREVYSSFFAYFDNHIFESLFLN